MGNEYMKDGRTVYFEARKQAAMYNETLYSREGAARMIGVSPSTLADYELGNTKVVPVDKVVLMADLYNCPNLKTGYCKHECPIGKGRPLATEVPGVEGAALRLVQQLNTDKLNDLKDTVISIAADGKISEDEKVELREIVEKLNGISYSISEIRLVAEKVLGEQV